MSSRRTRTHSICRFCSNYCPIMVDLEDGKIVKISGDRENPLWKGHSCERGRVQHIRMAHPDRLLQSQKRLTDGTYAPIEIEQAMDEIAAKLSQLIEVHGPRSIAAYNGTFFLSSTTHGVVFEALMHAIGSPMQFTANTIDKPGKGIARALMGTWMAPPTSFVEPEAILFMGVNPLVSYSGLPNGCPSWLGEAVKNGTKLIVVDPRRTETAKKATLYLQARPGSDIALLAALLNVILREQLHDAEFVAENVSGIEVLTEAVKPFTPERVAGLADIPAASIVEAARTFGPTRRGFVLAGTGPNFAGSGTLLEYLALALDIVCGHVLREGDRVPVAPVLLPPREYKAQAAAPTPARIEPMMYARGLASTPAGAPTGALADEILYEGEGRVRALISGGGSPVAAWPDQAKVVKAMERLELFVQIDPWMSASSKVADYVIAPKMSLETPGTTHLLEYYSGHVAGYGMTQSYSAYTERVADVPEGSDLVEEWEFFYGLAQRLGVEIALAPTFGLVSLAAASRTAKRVPLDMANKPTSEEVIELMCTSSRIPLAEVKEHARGNVDPAPPLYVRAKDEGWDQRLDVANPEMIAELTAQAEAAQPQDYGPAFPYRLLPRRNRGMYNSGVNDGLATRGKTHNPAYMNPADITELGLEAGDLVELESPWGAVLAIVEDDSALRPGVVSMFHAYGDTLPASDREDYLRRGSNTSLLIGGMVNPDAFSGQPMMGNVPLSIRKAQSAEVAATA